MALVFTDAEISKVQKKYPGISRTAPDTVEGELNLDAVYENLRLRDNYHIRITASNPHSARIPALWEIGNRTPAIANKFGIQDLRTLHRNPEGSACVCVKQVEKQKFPPGSTLIRYLEELAVPYLYGLTFFEKHGRWPWGDYSHGSLGLFEYYAENTAPQTCEDIEYILPSIRREINWKEYHKQLRKPSGDRSCLCGSGKKFSKCHSRAWEGLQIMVSEMNRIGIDRKNLFDRITQR